MRYGDIIARRDANLIVVDSLIELTDVDGICSGSTCCKTGNLACRAVDLHATDCYGSERYIILGCDGVEVIRRVFGNGDILAFLHDGRSLSNIARAGNAANLYLVECVTVCVSNIQGYLAVCYRIGSIARIRNEVIVSRRTATQIVGRIIDCQAGQLTIGDCACLYARACIDAEAVLSISGIGEFYLCILTGSCDALNCEAGDEVTFFILELNRVVRRVNDRLFDVCLRQENVFIMDVGENRLELADGHTANRCVRVGNLHTPYARPGIGFLVIGGNENFVVRTVDRSLVYATVGIEEYPNLVTDIVDILEWDIFAFVLIIAGRRIEGNRLEVIVELVLTGIEPRAVTLDVVVIIGRSICGGIRSCGILLVRNQVECIVVDGGRIGRIGDTVLTAEYEMLATRCSCINIGIELERVLCTAKIFRGRSGKTIAFTYPVLLGRCGIVRIFERDRG